MTTNDNLTDQVNRLFQLYAEAFLIPMDPHLVEKLNQLAETELAWEKENPIFSDSWKIAMRTRPPEPPLSQTSATNLAILESAPRLRTAWKNKREHDIPIKLWNTVTEVWAEIGRPNDFELANRFQKLMDLKQQLLETLKFEPGEVRLSFDETGLAVTRLDWVPNRRVELTQVEFDFAKKVNDNGVCEQSEFQHDSGNNLSQIKKRTNKKLEPLGIEVKFKRKLFRYGPL